IAVHARNLWDAIGPLVKQIAGLWTELSPLSIAFKAFEPVLPVIGDLLARVGDVLTPIAEAIIPVLTTHVQGLVRVFGMLIQAVVPLLEPILAIIAPLLDLAQAILPPLVELTGVLATGGIAVLEGAFAAFLPVLQ